MASRALPGLGLTGFWDYGTNFKDGMDVNLRLLSAVTQLAVLSRVAAVPGSPSNGDIHLLTAGANVDTLAVRDAGAWVYLTPLEGWKAFVRDTNATWVFVDGAWNLFDADDIPITALAGVTATTVQQALYKLSHHIDFLQTQLEAEVTASGHSMPAYVPPA